MVRVTTILFLRGGDFIMEEVRNITEMVSVEYLISAVIVLVALGVFLTKIAPVLKDILDFYRKFVNKYEGLQDQINKNTEDIVMIKEKVSNESTRVNQLQAYTAKQQKYIQESLEEREIMLRSLLGIIKGLQEVGANGSTKGVEEELQSYLVKKSHKSHTDDFGTA